jgi:hypothetical protein
MKITAIKLATSFVFLALLAMTGVDATMNLTTSNGLKHKHVGGGLRVKVCNGDFEFQSDLSLLLLVLYLERQPS